MTATDDTAADDIDIANHPLVRAEPRDDVRDLLIDIAQVLDAVITEPCPAEGLCALGVQLPGGSAAVRIRPVSVTAASLRASDLADAADDIECLERFRKLCGAAAVVYVVPMKGHPSGIVVTAKSSNKVYPTFDEIQRMSELANKPWSSGGDV